MTRTSEELSKIDWEEGHEVIEAFVDQSQLVTIWSFFGTAADGKSITYFQYERWALPDSFDSWTDAEIFKTETPHLNDVGVQVGTKVSYDTGTLEESVYSEDLTELMKKLTKKTIKRQQERDGQS